jgi:adenosylcobinamide-GDP ribazoletransferase
MFKITNKMLSQWRYFLTAVMFFTRIPIHFAHFNQQELNQATRYFPLVGILVGGVGALVFYIAHSILPLSIAILLSMAATILLTGAFHEDGLADTIDGLGGGWTREQALTIMVDSRIGSYGAIGLVLVLLTKYQSLVEISAHFIPIALVAGHALSRLCAVLVMYHQSYVKTDGKAKPLATNIKLYELVIAGFFGLLPLYFVGLSHFLALFPVALVWVWFSKKLKSRLGGYTGDCLGAMQQLTEIAFYIGLLISHLLPINFYFLIR